MTDAMFDPIADLCDRFASLTQTTYRSWIERSLPENGGRAVDLGCGSGRFLDLLLSRYAEVLGVDASSRMIDLAGRRHPSARLEVADLWDITPERVGTFGLVLSVNTLHHLGPGPARYLAHAVNTLAYRAYRISRTLGSALRVGVSRRSVGDAAVVYRLRRHQQWRSLAADAHTLSRNDFRRHCAAAFPGAVFTDTLDPSVCAVTGRLPVPLAVPGRGGALERRL